MLNYIIRRLLQTGVVLAIITVVTFTIIHLAPGGPEILLDERLTEEDRQILRKAMGLDKPLHIQYFNWVRSIAVGDFGYSFMEGLPVIDLLARRLPNTIRLAAAALLLSVCIGIPLGVVSAVNKNTAIDRFATFFAFIGISTPSFWLALTGIIVFAVNLRVLPASGMGPLGGDVSFLRGLKYMVMPVFVLSLSPLAQIVRYTRSSVLTVLGEDYVRTAKAKGVKENVILFRHVLRNAFNPVLTLLGLLIPPLIGGSVIVEQIFAWPGMGRLAVDAALKRDYPIVMGITVVICLIVALTNLVVDLFYGVLDPRVRLVSNDN